MFTSLLQHTHVQPPPGKLVSSCVMVPRGGKKKAITTTSPFPPSSLQFLLLNTVPCGMGRSFGQSGSAVLFLLSQLLVPHSSLLARQHEELKCPWLCVKTALQHLKWCVISTVLIKKKNTKTQHHMSLCEEC